MNEKERYSEKDKAEEHSTEEDWIKTNENWV